MYKIPLIKNTFYNEKETRKELSEMINSGCQLSMGSKCNEFEMKFSKWQKRKYSVLFNSGGSANLALIQALKNLGKLNKCDKVGISSLTWSTNVMPIIQLGLIPVPIDINITTLQIDINCLKICADIKCLFITNALGFVNGYDKIIKHCSDNNIILIEDNCEALGSVGSDGVLSGNNGLASTFSFYVAHHLSTIEGGMVCTDDEEIYTMLKIVRANGWDRNLKEETKIKLRNEYNIENSKYTFYDLGFNLRPTEITGLLGSIQLEYLDDIIYDRETNYNLILKEIEKNEKMIKNYCVMKTISAFAIPFVYKEKEDKIYYQKQFEKYGIEIRPMIAGNITNQPFWKKYCKPYNLPGVEFIEGNSFYCGNYPDMTYRDIELIIEALK